MSFIGQPSEFVKKAIGVCFLAVLVSVVGTFVSGFCYVSWYIIKNMGVF